MIENAFIIAMIVLFLHATTWEGMIFDGIKNFNIPGWIRKPLYSCPICMTPWWGTLLYWIFFHGSLCGWLLTVGAASGINVFSVIFLYIKKASIETIEKNGE